MSTPQRVASTITGILLLLAIVTNQSDGMQKPINQELKKLTGKWKLTNFESKGKQTPVKNDFFIIIDDKTILWSPWFPDELSKTDAQLKFAYKIIQDTNPQTLHLMNTIPIDEFETICQTNWMYGIELKDNKLRIVYDVSEPDHLPQSFDTTKGKLRKALTLERTK